MGTLIIGLLTVLTLIFPDSLGVQCKNAGQSLEEVTQNLTAIDSLGKAYVKYAETHPNDTLGTPLRSNGLTPEKFCAKIGITMPVASMMQRDRKTFWGPIPDPSDSTISNYFVAIITPNSSRNLPEVLITIDVKKHTRHLSYVVPLPSNKSVTFDIQQ